MTWDRITIRRLPDGSFIGEGRLHARFAVGDILKTPIDAFNSASDAMDAMVAAIPKPKPRKVLPNDEDLL